MIDLEANDQISLSDSSEHEKTHQDDAKGRRIFKQARRDSGASTASSSSSFVAPPPTQLTVQQRVVAVSAPGAFSVVPDPQYQVLSPQAPRRRNNTDTDSSTVLSTSTEQQVSSPLHQSHQEVLVSATLIETSAQEGTTATASIRRTLHHEEAQLPRLVQASPAPQRDSLLTVVKKSRMAQCGLVFCVVLVLGLTVALGIVINTAAGSENDDLLLPNDNIFQQDPIIVPTLAPSPVPTINQGLAGTFATMNPQDSEVGMAPVWNSNYPTNAPSKVASPNTSPASTAPNTSNDEDDALNDD